MARQGKADAATDREPLAIVWRRVGANAIEWTVTGDWFGEKSQWHCNRYATFHGPATAENYERTQRHGWASSVWADRDPTVTHLLIRAYGGRARVSPDYVPEDRR